MCVVSMISDHYQNKWQQGTLPGQSGTITITNQPFEFGNLPVTQQQFDELKKEVLEMKALLLAAKTYDEKTNQKDCEMKDKVAVLQKIAQLVGVTLEDVFKKEV